jgi:hypothetical protein
MLLPSKDKLMPKYYISSGDLQHMTDKPQPKAAAIDAFENLKSCPVSQLGKLTVVSEHGFDAGHDDDMYFCTVDLLDETDQLESYVHTEWIED